MNVEKRSCVVILLLVVLAVVESQRTTGDVADENFNLVYEVTRLKEELTTLKSMIPGASNSDQARGGSSYVRWGRTTCEGDATLLYEGYAAGARCNMGGGGSNHLCLPRDPEWENYVDGFGNEWSGEIGGIEYEISAPGNNYVFSAAQTSLKDKPAPCAVCDLDRRSRIRMFPAKTSCPAGWTKEYAGYLASEQSSSDRPRPRSTYICWDKAPEIALGAGVSQNHAVIYPTAAVCGLLPCSTYPNGRELTCVVCSK